uniref:nucleotide sugar dehydrogenase n=1 Tax=Dermacoccus nishinomiyaensis TaxID=1274 RepID=UPI00248E8E01
DTVEVPDGSRMFAGVEGERFYFVHSYGVRQWELVTNDRIIGGMTPEAAKRGKAVYATFCQGELLETDDVTAEMAKLTENAFRDVNIAFANELAEISRHIGVDVWEVIRLANRHPRVNILNPGPGVGGHCIAVDPWFIVDAAPDQANLIRTARETNDARPDTVVADVARIAPSGAVIACLGLAFKANIDDLRESPAVTVVSRLSKADPTWQLLAVEPHVEHLPAALETLENVRLEGLDVALASADAVVLLVDHDRFKAISNSEIRQIPHVDTRGIWRE